MYNQQLQRKNAKEKSKNITDYLKTLGMKITIYEDELFFLSRTSQLTQKTNQFNLTTIRYTENQIKNLIKSNDYLVVTISVRDNFGDNGLTGLCILEFKKFDEVEIDTFLLSCRIIGRNVEYAFLNYIIDTMKKKGVKTINSKFFRTQKNDQVSSFFDNSGFSVKEKTNEMNKYFLEIKDYKPKNLNYIKFEYEKK